MENKKETTKIAIFRKKEIRKTVHNKEWWFVIEDVVQALTDSTQPAGYIKDMRRRDPELSKGWGQIATPLPIQTAGGRNQDAVDNPKPLSGLQNQTRGHIT